MITEEQIRVLTTRYQTNELNVLREYFQHVFLSYFYQQDKTNSIFFKGGTALRFIYKSPRFSEDLDFSTTNRTQHEIEEILESTLDAIEKEGIETMLNEAKSTSGGYLANMSFATQTERTVVQI